jgi:hypothetical protein
MTARLFDPRFALLLCVLSCGHPPPAAAPASPARPGRIGADGTASATAPAEPAQPAPAQAPNALPALTLKTIDVYGTTQIDIAWVKDRLGDRIHRLVDGLGDSDNTLLKNEILDEIRAAHPQLGQVDLSIVGMYKAGGMEAHVTIDAVEKPDMKSRVRFRAAPTGDVEDPAGLIAAWNQYEETAHAMMGSGELPPTRSACPAFHCFGSYDHEKLRPFAERFPGEVPANEAKLVRVLRDDKDEEDRGAAAYLLAHIKDGKKLVALLLRVLDDPSSHTRNSAIRVLGDIAAFHPEVPVPLAPVLRLLDGPTTSDRNKATLVVLGLLGRPDGAKYHRRIIKQAGATLIKLLALEQPNNHDHAYMILKQISGKDLGEHDIAAWQRWLATQR